MNPTITFAALGAVFAFAACGRIDDRVEIVDSLAVGELVPQIEKPRLDVSARERLAVLQAEQEKGPFRFSIPYDWEIVEGEGSMRILDMRFGKELEGEVYLSHLPGAAGGVIGNLDRWRKQMGLPPMTPEEMAALSSIEMMQGTAPFIDLEGAFTKMGETEAKPDYRMLGAVRMLSEQGPTLFVKMTGPKELVDEHALDFKRFCYFLRLGGAM